MKAIQLESLTLRNWRGEKERTTRFNLGSATRICGGNGLGKSRHMDAFCWLLFGKDSKDRKDFNLRTADGNGNVLHRCECSVEGVLLVDGEEITLKREYKEQWAKPRGQVEEVFKGNVTECTWNGVPVRVGDYKERISKEIIDESLFKMLTNTEYFLSLKQEVQRDVLMQIAGVKSDAEIAASNEEFVALLDTLSGKSLSDYRKQVAAEKKRLKAQADEIGPRIDQTQKMKPEEEDWASLEGLLADKKKELEEVAELLHSADARKQSATDKKAALNREKKELEEQMHALVRDEERRAAAEADKKNEARNAIEKELKAIHHDRAECNIDISRGKERATYLGCETAKIAEELDKLREEWKSIRAMQYDGSDTCPHCGQRLPESMLQDAMQKFEDYKAKQLAGNQAKGKSLASQLNSYKEELEARNKAAIELTQKLATIDERISGLYAQLEATPKAAPAPLPPDGIPAYVEKKKRLGEIAQEVAGIGTATTDEALLERERMVKAAIKNIEAMLGNRALIARADKEVARLEQEGRDLAQKVADIEKREHVAAQFSRARIEDCESRINALFETVRWKLFDTTLDGNEFETCIPMIGGVAYGTCNTAKQVNAGIDIANTLAKHYGIYAPMFIDRAESVNTFIASNSQMILLQVTSEKQLTIR